MKKYYLFTLGLTLLLGAMALPASAQVSNDNEDGVYRTDGHYSQDFVPGEVIVKFKDESTIQVRRNAKGQFRAASISAVDKLLQAYGAEDMEKLFPAEVAKPKSKLRRSIAPNGATVQERNLDKIFRVRLNTERPDSTLQLIEQLKTLSEVEYAEPNYLVFITADVPVGSMPHVGSAPQIHRAAPMIETDATTICPKPSNNPLYFRQYGITQQNIHQLWNKPIINKKRPVIAILDTGVDISHPDLMDNIWTNTAEAEGETAYDDDNNKIVDDIHGWNFVDNYGDVTDRNGHGTHVAGIAAAADNSIGIVGANPLALIMPLKVLNDRGVGDQATIAKAIQYAAANGADVLNMSFGSPALSGVLKDALDYAYQTAILVGSAGNYGVDIYTNTLSVHGTNYPAAYYLVLGVEASASNYQRAPFSNYDPDGPIYSEDGIDGRNYEIQVPGDKIYSTLPGGKYNQLSGTSMSAPLLAGAISALQMVKEYPSKDVLFGDLIHLEADFAAIYSDDTPRMPKIDLVAMNVDDNVAGNSNIDGQVDVGETIKFTPVLRNTWADATDIRLKLTVDPAYAAYVEIENPEVDFGYSISAYGRETAQTPIQVKFAENIGDNTRIKFNMEIAYHENSEAINTDVYVTVNNMVKISGLISENTTLTADHIYYVNDNIGITEGTTLTIEPGTRLEFAKGIGLTSFGKLVANGTPEKPIIFTGHNGVSWSGIKSHDSNGGHSHKAILYTNVDQNLFTLLPTETTPNRWNGMKKHVYYGDSESSPVSTFLLRDYMNIEEVVADMTDKQNLLTDPNYLTPAVLQAISDIEVNCSQYPTQYSEEQPNSAYVELKLFSWCIYDNPRDTISFCKIEGCDTQWSNPNGPFMKDCYLSSCKGQYIFSVTGIEAGMPGIRNTITDFSNYTPLYKGVTYCNIVNNNVGHTVGQTDITLYSNIHNNNYFNNRYWLLGIDVNTPTIDKSIHPSYLGTTREDLLRPYIYEMGNGGGFGKIDLSNMPDRPYAEAHGIVWKVCVNGKDAQDEYEDLAPLGVGKHKFEVYFNRPMNKLKAPEISFGVREPYTQQTVNEDGSWNEEGTIYTAYKTISGRTMSDGVNRIYVRGAEDNEFFECPYEKTRFNVNIQAAGSLATGFMGEAGLGKVTLTWNNENNDITDAMGYNVYRYTVDAEGKADTTCINKEIVDIEDTEYIDYDVVPGTTYYYYYKVLSTDLKEYDISNVVSVTPQTASLGDANGSGDVDVADVITTVNFAAGMEPKPFIFEAADMNIDAMIDILDVIGIIQKIMNPAAGAPLMAEAVATYTIEDGVLYVESPVDLAGVQVQLSLSEESREKNEKFTVAPDLKGFEHVSAWLSDKDYLFMAYNMSGKTLSAGKHALLNIGDAQIASIRLSNAMGGNVPAVEGETTNIEQIITGASTTTGIYNLHGQRIAARADQLQMLPKGVYLVDGKKVVKWK